MGKFVSCVCTAVQSIQLQLHTTLSFPANVLITVCPTGIAVLGRESLKAMALVIFGSSKVWYICFWQVVYDRNPKNLNEKNKVNSLCPTKIIFVLNLNIYSRLWSYESGPGN